MGIFGSGKYILDDRLFVTLPYHFSQLDLPTHSNLLLSLLIQLHKMCIANIMLPINAHRLVHNLGSLYGSYQETRK